MGFFVVMQKVDIKLFSTVNCTIKKDKWHCIEFDADTFSFKANYLSAEKIEEAPKECWRYWDNVYYKKAVTAYGYSRDLYTEEDKEFVWIYTISVFGTEQDIIIAFESHEEIKTFHDIFKAYMNA